MEHVGLAYASLKTKPNWPLERISILVAYCGSPRVNHLELPTGNFSTKIQNGDLHPKLTFVLVK